MKKVTLTALSFLFTHFLFAQAPEMSRDVEGNKVLKGFITKKDLVTDTAFTWFAKNQKDYIPDQLALKALRSNRDSIHIIAFGGTWCHDTQFILPKFFTLLDAAGFPASNLIVLGVDHDKKSAQHLSEAFNITNVPTIIIMKKGQEIGRVIEYGKHGMFDQELGEIINNTATKTN